MLIAAVVSPASSSVSKTVSTSRERCFAFRSTIVSRSEHRDPGRAHRGERRAVFDETLLAAVPLAPEVRNVVPVGMRAGCDRTEADGGQRRKRQHRTAVLAMLGEEAKRGCVGGLECGRGQPVDDDEDDRLRLRRGGVSRGQAIGARRGAPAHGSAGVRRAPALRLPRGTERGTNASATPTSEASVSNRAVPPRVPPRRSVPRTRGADPRAPQIARRLRRRQPRPTGRTGIRSRRPPPLRRRARERTAQGSGGRDADRGAEADENADRVPVPHAARLHMARHRA